MRIAMPSPGRRPAARKSCAARFEASSSCRYVIVAPVSAMTIAGWSGRVRACSPGCMTARHATIAMTARPAGACRDARLTLWTVAFVRDEDGTVWLDFGDGAVQSRMLRADPARLVLEYSRLMMGFLLFVPAPARIAMIGLGGGSLAKYCRARLPDADFTAVEISPEIMAYRD